MPRRLIVLCCLLAVSAHAQESGEKRAQRLFGELRCQVCAGESIASSDAELAQDIRRIVRRRLADGESDRSIERYLIGRYGETILLDPPLASRTAVLWAAPALLLAAGVAFLFLRRRAV